MTFLSMLSMAVIASAPSGSEVTIYNQGFALVKETRSLNLKSGQQLVAIEDVAEMIEANSVAIRSVSAPGSFTVLEQNYQYDLINSAAILNKAVGGKIALNRVLPNGQKEVIRGTLMSAPTQVVSTGNGSQYTYNGLVLQADDGRILLDPTGEIEVTTIPEGMISKPTLLWEILANRAGANTVELSYLTQGITWSADYVLSLDGLGKLGNLKGWVTLNNNSGATYKDAKLKLLAGEVQRAMNRPQGFGGGRGGMEAKADVAQFAEEQFSDYHLYTLQRPTTVRNKEQKQVSLLEAFDIPVVKRLVIDPMRMYPGYRPSEGEVGTGPLKPQIRIEFKNDKASNLGMPLPMGKVKVFMRDNSGALQMLGEDQIEHTPKDEKLSLVVGRAFDVVVERKRTKFEYIRRGGTIIGARESFEVEVRNRKETPEAVTVIERLWNDYRIIQTNMEFTKLDSNTLQVVIELKANETKKLAFSVEYLWD